MAYTKTEWINNVTPISAEKLNKIEEGIYNLQNIELIAVSETAPETCEIGDKYFNTTTNLIYVAEETNTWGTEGINAIQNVFYVVIDKNANYYYDGTTLVAVGGGAGDSLPVGSIVEFDGDVIPDGYEEVSDIIETGSNANGTYIKFGDGTLICMQMINVKDLSIVTAWGGLFVSVSQTVPDFPIPFIEKPKSISKDYIGTSSNALLMNDGDFSNTNAGKFILARGTSSGATGTLSITAIGRWK